MDEFGRVDVLVNNAGIGTAVPATRETPEQFRPVVDINLNGAYWMAQACGRVMQPGSSIVNIGSVLGLTTAGLPQAAYAATKAAIIGLTRDLAQQWTHRKGIRVNALAPGFFASEMTDQYPDGYLDQMMWRVVAGPQGRGRGAGRRARSSSPATPAATSPARPSPSTAASRSPDGRRCAYQVVDVFTDTAFTGNPLAVVLDTDGMTTARCRRSRTSSTCPRRRSRSRRPRPARTTGCGSSRRRPSCPSPATRRWGRPG